MPAALAAAVSPSMSAPCSFGRRRLITALYPIFLISGIAAGVVAPAQAIVVSSFAKLVTPDTVSFVACAVAAVATSRAGTIRARVRMVRIEDAPGKKTLFDVRERVAALLRAVDRHDA